MQQKTVKPSASAFPEMNAGYARTFRAGRLGIGLVVPLEAYPGSPVPSMQDHLERVQLADALGFAAVWLRDIPFDVPTFGDAGQLFDPFVYLGMLAGQTRQIALGVASIILPLRHPAHVAKAAASVDVLSGGRLLLGVAAGDRPEEFAAFGRSAGARDVLFRDSFDYIRQMSRDLPRVSNRHGQLNGTMRMLPRPVGGELPMLVTGGSRQTPEWIASHADGWMTYPRSIGEQARVVEDWNSRVETAGRSPVPTMQPLYIDLLPDDDAPAQPFHLGLRGGVNALREHLKSLEHIGMNHVALNLRFNQLDIGTTLSRLAHEMLPEFE